MRTLDSALKHERYFRCLTGLTIEEFHALAHDILEPWKRANIERLSSRKRTNRIGQGRKNVFPSVEEQLFAFLFWIRLYPTYLFMEITLGADACTFFRINKRIAPLLAARGLSQAPVGRRRIRSMDELREVYPEAYESIVDATEQRIERPQDARKNRKYRSGRKKAHSLKTQIITNASTGMILHISRTVEGKRHDFKLFQETVAPSIRGDRFLLMADSGYQGIEKQFPNLQTMVAKKRFRGVAKLTQAEKRFNHALSKVRVRIEHVFSKMKKFKALSDVYRHDINGYNSVFRAVAGLVNLRISLRAQAA